MGDLKVYDIRSYVNLSKLKPTFERLPRVGQNRCGDLVLTHDVRDGVRGYTLMPKENAQMFWCSDERTVTRVLDVFAQAASSLENKWEAHTNAVCMQLTRGMSNAGDEGHRHAMTDQGWHHGPEGTRHMAIVCVERDNVYGGIDEFKNDWGEVAMELPPGHMVVFDAAKVQHRVTALKCAQWSHVGHHDVIKITTGGMKHCAS